MWVKLADGTHAHKGGHHRVGSARHLEAKVWKRLNLIVALVCLDLEVLACA